MQLLLRQAGADAPGVDELAVRRVIAEQKRADVRPTPFRVGPADDDELLAVEALRLDSQAAVAGCIRAIDPRCPSSFIWQA
jgi:hypothetical protein